MPAVKARQWLATIHVRKAAPPAAAASLISDALVQPGWFANPQAAQDALQDPDFTIKQNDFAALYIPGLIAQHVGTDTLPTKLKWACGQFERSPEAAERLLAEEPLHQDQGLHLQCFFRFDERMTKNQTLAYLNAVSWTSLTPVHVDNGASDYPLKEETREPGLEQFSFKLGINAVTTAESAQQIIKAKMENCSTWGEVLEIDGVASRMRWVSEVWKVMSTSKFKKLCTDESRLEFQTLLPHQQLMIDERATLPHRQVMILYDPVGGWGKTVLTKYLRAHNKAFTTTGGEFEKIMKSYIDFAGDDEPTRWVIFDIPRAKDIWPYAAIESFLNGEIHHGRYEGGMMVIPNGCLVIIMCNSIPDDIKDKLSEDRLVIKNLSIPPALAPGIVLLN